MSDIEPMHIPDDWKIELLQQRIEELEKENNKLKEPDPLTQIDRNKIKNLEQENARLKDALGEIIKLCWGKDSSKDHYDLMVKYMSRIKEIAKAVK